MFPARISAIDLSARDAVSTKEFHQIVENRWSNGEETTDVFVRPAVIRQWRDEHIAYLEAELAKATDPAEIDELECRLQFSKGEVPGEGKVFIGTIDIMGTNYGDVRVHSKLGAN